MLPELRRDQAFAAGGVAAAAIAHFHSTRRDYFRASAGSSRDRRCVLRAQCEVGSEARAGTRSGNAGCGDRGTGGRGIFSAYDQVVGRWLRARGETAGAAYGHPTARTGRTARTHGRLRRVGDRYLPSAHGGYAAQAARLVYFRVVHSMDGVDSNPFCHPERSQGTGSLLAHPEMLVPARTSSLASLGTTDCRARLVGDRL